MSVVIHTRRLLLVIIFALLQACMTPAQRLGAIASEFGFAALTLPGDGYFLSAYARYGDTHGNVLHVYIEGDGTPWATPTVAANDPTARNPLMLRMMALDPAPSLYLGRPCYNGHADDPGCSTLTWTDSRYSATVVASMVSALGAFLKDHPYPRLVFMGHSGGGALALLMAPRFRSTRAVVTLAGNLDIDLWADYHRYARLVDSLNPADFPNSGFAEWHYLGKRDTQIPPSLLLPVIAKRPGAHAIVLEAVEHACCWEKVWPAILRSLPQHD